MNSSVVNSDSVNVQCKQTSRTFIRFIWLKKSAEVQFQELFQDIQCCHALKQTHGLMEFLDARQIKT